MRTSIFGKIYSRYRKAFLNGLKEKRGATRLSGVLRRMAERSLESPGEGDDIFELEWDNLIVIDACRHDLYEEVNGTADSRITKASCTPQFISKNFGRDLDDIVYISANPFLTPEYMEEFTGKKNPFHEVYRTYSHGWDPELNTIPPEKVVEDAIKAEKKYPDKKKIIHFMQPHHPFIESDIEGAKPRLPHKDNEETNVWERLEKGELSHEEVWKAYRKNLEVLDEPLDKLKKELKGRIVLTSDHGNLVGENGIYGHPEGCEVKILREVPLVVLKKGEKSESKELISDVDV